MKFKERLIGSGHLHTSVVFGLFTRGLPEMGVGTLVAQSSGAALRGHAEHCESHRRQDLDPCAKFRSVSTTAKIDRVLLTAVILLKC